MLSRENDIMMRSMVLLAMESNLADAQSIPPAIGKSEAKFLAIISLSYTTLNLCISLFFFRDVYPMSIYPTLISFITVFFYIKERLPGKKVTAIFLCLYQVAIIIGCIIMAMQNGIEAIHIDFSKFLEPVFFLPLIAIIFLLANAMNHQQVIPRMYLVCGFVFVVVAVFSLIPGNPLIMLMKNSDIDYQLIDANVPAALVINIYLWYHVPVMSITGCIAFMLGCAELYTKKKINNIFIIATFIGIMFSIYVIGVAFTWILLQRSRDATF